VDVVIVGGVLIAPVPKRTEYVIVAPAATETGFHLKYIAESLELYVSPGDILMVTSLKSLLEADPYAPAQ
jgi:hypothetical protein